jgi:hypothetical protein
LVDVHDRKMLLVEQRTSSSLVFVASLVAGFLLQEAWSTPTVVALAAIMVFVALAALMRTAIKNPPDAPAEPGSTPTGCRSNSWALRSYRNPQQAPRERALCRRPPASADERSGPADRIGADFLPEPVTNTPRAGQDAFRHIVLSPASC